eukprot:Rhum_TRINITY_DN8254_c0_g2::Rhum_TRINITY_DN8254_c0_g2_i1::g.26940::m.26940
MSQRNNHVIEAQTERVAELERRAKELEQTCAQRAAEAQQSFEAMQRAEGTSEVLRRQLEREAEQARRQSAGAQAELQGTKDSLGWLSQNLEEVSAQLQERQATIEEFRRACERKDDDVAQLKALLRKSAETLDLLQECAAQSGDEQRQRAVQLAQEVAVLTQGKAGAEAVAAQLSGEVERLQRLRETGCAEEAAARERHAHAIEQVESRHRALQERLAEEEAKTAAAEERASHAAAASAQEAAAHAASLQDAACAAEA